MGWNGRFGRPSMPWNEVSVVDQRREFVRLALQEGANRRGLCRRFGISPDVGYKWLRRWQAGDHELADQLRRPKSMPKRSMPEVEARVLAVRDKHPAWSAQDCPLPEARRPDRTGALHSASDPVPERTDQAERESRAEPFRPPVREGRAQSTLADGLQGPHAACRRKALPSAHHGR